MTRSAELPIPSPWPHRLAVVLCCATFPLIWLGGLVTTYDAGMAVPDWPTTYGYNLFLYPWQTWVLGPFDLFIEHGHRLLGAAVGLLAIGFLVSVLLTDRRRWLRVAAVTAVGLVILQGLLGGARVRLDERGLAMIHGCFGLATFAYLAAMAVVTSRFWSEPRAGRVRGSQSSDSQVASGVGGRLQRLSLLTTGIVYMQVVVGAMLRHIPVTASHQVFRVAVLFHLLCAAAVLVHSVLVARTTWRDVRRESRLVRPAMGLLGLVCLQLSLGIATWVLKYGWPTWFADLTLTATYTIAANSMLQAVVTTAHVALGALILAQSVVLSLRAARFFRSDATFVGRVSCQSMESKSSFDDASRLTMEWAT